MAEVENGSDAVAARVRRIREQANEIVAHAEAQTKEITQWRQENGLDDQEIVDRFFSSLDDGAKQDAEEMEDEMEVELGGRPEEAGQAVSAEEESAQKRRIRDFI